MRQHKILLTALLVLALVCAAGGCGTAPADEPAPGAPTAPADGGDATTPADPATDTDAAPATLTVAYADDAALPAVYDTYSEGDHSVRALIATDRTVTDLRLVTLTVGDDGSGGLAYTTGEALYRADRLTPDRPLLWETGFAGDLPERAVVYTDADGSVHQLALTISGADGSLLLTEL